VNAADLHTQSPSSLEENTATAIQNLSNKCLMLVIKSSSLGRV